MRKQPIMKIAEYFLDHPYQEVYLRELAKKLKLSTFAVKKYVDFLLKEDFIKEERKANLRYLRANTSNLFFKHVKIALSLKKLIQSGIIDFLKEHTINLSSIVLFGSVAKGEDSLESDIDIVAIGKEKSVSMSAFEKKLGRSINTHFFSWSEWNKEAEKNKAFYFDVIAYGVSLYGELPIVK